MHLEHHIGRVRSNRENSDADGVGGVTVAHGQSGAFVDTFVEVLLMVELFVVAASSRRTWSKAAFGALTLSSMFVPIIFFALNLPDILAAFTGARHSVIDASSDQVVTYASWNAAMRKLLIVVLILVSVLVIVDGVRN